MIASKSIIFLAEKTIRKYKTKDPFKIAKAMGIELVVKELGNLKGFYKVIYDIPFIFLCSSLDSKEAKIVLAHEIGHHILHK
nr:ImmA/IrrE family metallo-endopeptidase [Clostridia bacterium]